MSSSFAPLIKTRQMMKKRFGLRISFIRRSRIKMASKILADYQDCDEYVPRKQKGEKSAVVAAEAPENDLKMETITEEEATKVVIAGTHDYPSAPGFSKRIVLMLQACLSLPKMLLTRILPRTP